MPKIRMFMPKILTSVYSFYKIYVKLSKMVYKVNSNVLKKNCHNIEDMISTNTVNMSGFFMLPSEL